MVAAEATKVNGDVITSSPGPMPPASRARCRALVPEFTPMASAAPQYPANSFSNAATSGPRMNCAFSRTPRTAASNSLLIVRYWALRSNSGIMVFPRGLSSGYLQLWNAAAAGWEGPLVCRARSLPDMIDSEVWPAREIVACHAGAQRGRLHYPDPGAVYGRPLGQRRRLRDRGGGRRQHGCYRGPPARVQCGPSRGGAGHQYGAARLRHGGPVRIDED